MSFPSPHILCVDDDKDWCELLKIMLQHSADEYKVTPVFSVQQALVLIENLTFDLYILDYALPDETGMALCRKIRRNDSDTPILFYSAMARTVDRQMAKEAGANEYLVKPNDLDRLTETIKRLLDDAVQSKPYDYASDNSKKDSTQKPESSVETEIKYNCLS